MTSVRCPIFSRSGASGQSNAWRGQSRSTSPSTLPSAASMTMTQNRRRSGADTGGRVALSPAHGEGVTVDPAANVDLTAIHRFWAVHTIGVPDTVRKNGLGR
jgi:hypothetical protein